MYCAKVQYSDINPLRDSRYALSCAICAIHTICPSDKGDLYHIEFAERQIYRIARQYIVKNYPKEFFFWVVLFLLLSGFVNIMQRIL